jgi:hypothetical protein
MKKVLFIAASALIATTAVASAASINGKQSYQANKIEKGRESGKITWTEGLKLHAEQKKIARAEAEFKSDGYLSTSERRKLAKMQHDAGKDIAKAKNNSWSRVWWLPRVGY